MPKIGFPVPTAKNRFQILNLHPKKHVLKKNVVFKVKKIPPFLQTLFSKSIIYYLLLLLYFYSLLFYLFPNYLFSYFISLPERSYLPCKCACGL